MGSSRGSHRPKVHHRALRIDRDVELAKETLPEESPDPRWGSGQCRNGGSNTHDSRPRFVWDINRVENNARALQYS